MKRQVDFALYVRTVGWQVGQNGAVSIQAFRDEMKQTYPFSDGWEVLSMEYIHLNPQGNDPEGLTFVVSLVKYKYDA